MVAEWVRKSILDLKGLSGCGWVFAIPDPSVDDSAKILSVLRFDVVLLFPTPIGWAKWRPRYDEEEKRSRFLHQNVFGSLLMGCVFPCNSELVARGFSQVFCAEAVTIDVTCCYILEGLWHCRPTCRTCNTCHSPSMWCNICTVFFGSFSFLVGRGAVITPPTHQGFRCLNLSRKHGGVACLMRFFHITKVEMSGLIHPFLSMVLLCCDTEWENCPDQKCLQKKSLY